MLLIFEEKHREHLAFLSGADGEVISEFSKIAAEFIKKGTNTKMYQAASQKLGVDAETVKNAVEGLMYLFTESSRHMLSDIDFQDSVITLGFSSELSQELLQLYKQNRQEIRHILGEMSMDLSHYHNLEWRFDIQLASRTLRHQINPTVLMKLHTMNEGKEEVHTMQTDPTNLVHLTQTLEAALQELKTAHCRRILRNI